MSTSIKLNIILQLFQKKKPYFCAVRVSTKKEAIGRELKKHAWRLSIPKPLKSLLYFSHSSIHLDHSAIELRV